MRPPFLSYFVVNTEFLINQSLKTNHCLHYGSLVLLLLLLLLFQRTYAHPQQRSTMYYMQLVFCSNAKLNSLNIVLEVLLTLRGFKNVLFKDLLQNFSRSLSLIELLRDLISYSSFPRKSTAHKHKMLFSVSHLPLFSLMKSICFSSSGPNVCYL